MKDGMIVEVSLLSSVQSLKNDIAVGEKALKKIDGEMGKR
jgi:hypothetical protein